MTTPCTHVVNLNVACEFRLTDYGKIVFDAWCEVQSRLVHGISTQAQVSALYLRDDGTCRMQLWEVANIFGHRMFNGATTLVVDNQLQLLQP